jgi:hypothetical protein
MHRFIHRLQPSFPTLLLMVMQLKMKSVMKSTKTMKSVFRFK